MVVDFFRFNPWMRELTHIPILNTLPLMSFGITRRTLEAEVCSMPMRTD
jgi:hypothetical protein